MSVYYDYAPILSRNALINMVVGGRGMGKTFGAKKLSINDYLKDGKHFVYLRRYKTELTNVKTYFADVSREYPDHEFRVEGRTAQIKVGKKWETFGYFLALSNALTLKGVSFANVKRVIYDEFMMAKGFLRYLPNEIHQFYELVNTIDRYEDRVSIIMNANAADLANPYFLSWNIEPFAGKIRRYQNGQVAVDFPDNREYAEQARRSRFGQLVSGTEYDSYALDNKFIHGVTSFISKKPETADYVMTIDHEGSRMSMWYDRPTLTWHATARKVREPEYFALTINNTNPDATVLLPRDGYIDTFRSAYRNRRMTFSSQQVHAQFQNMLAFVGTR